MYFKGPHCGFFKKSSYLSLKSSISASFFKEFLEALSQGYEDIKGGIFKDFLKAPIADFSKNYWNEFLSVAMSSI